LDYPGIPDADRMPRFGTYQIEVYQGWPIAEDGLPSPEPKLLVDTKEIKGDVLDHTGLQGMEIAEEVTMVCCPDLMSPLVQGSRKRFDNQLIKSVQVAMVDHCARLADRIAILDTPNGLTPQEAKDWRNANANYSDAVAKFAALYYPWVKVDGPNSKPIAVPPCGHIAGIYARNDRTRGVHKAPANEGVLGVTDIAASITKGEQEVLNPLGVNCIRTFPGRGMLVWGARTLSSDPAWRYISVRRLFNYVEKSIERGLQWVVFEPNDPDLWARVRRDVGAFLTNCWRDGMLFGRSPDQAFYVKCDEDLNPPEVRDVGLLIVEIGLAPVKPAEFVVFRFKQWAGGGQ
jgi:phage tail sheath protein FI